MVNVIDKKILKTLADLTDSFIICNNNLYANIENVIIQPKAVSFSADIPCGEYTIPSLKGKAKSYNVVSPESPHIALVDEKGAEINVTNKNTAVSINVPTATTTQHKLSISPLNFKPEISAIAINANNAFLIKLEKNMAYIAGSKDLIDAESVNYYKIAESAENVLMALIKKANIYSWTISVQEKEPTLIMDSEKWTVYIPVDCMKNIFSKMIQAINSPAEKTIKVATEDILSSCCALPTKQNWIITDSSAGSTSSIKISAADNSSWGSIQNVSGLSNPVTFTTKLIKMLCIWFDETSSLEFSQSSDKKLLIVRPAERDPSQWLISVLNQER